MSYLTDFLTPARNPSPYTSIAGDISTQRRQRHAYWNNIGVLSRNRRSYHYHYVICPCGYELSASYQNDGIQSALTYWGRDTIVANDILIYIFMNGNVWISLKNSINIVSKALINNMPEFVQFIDVDDQATSHFMIQWLTILTILQWWLSAKPQYFQRVSNGDNSVLR